HGRLVPHLDAPEHPCGSIDVPQRAEIPSEAFADGLQEPGNRVLDGGGIRQDPRDGMLRHEPLLQPLALTDVPDQGDAEPTPTLHEGTDRDLDRETRAVLSRVTSIEGRDLTRLESLLIPLRDGPVRIDVDVERADPDQLVARVPETVAGLLVHVQDG